MCFDKSKYHRQIPHSKLCVYVKFQHLVIILLEMWSFQLIFDPRGLENGVHMGNRSGYQAILKNNP